MFFITYGKGEIPLDTYHIDHLGPLPSTRKSYNHILVVIDAFSKFTWLYATKSTGTAEVLTHLRKQSIIFGNPRRIISDRGTAFTSKDFAEYCKMEGIDHSLIVAGVPRGNGQVERVNRTLIPLLSKLSAPQPSDWYKHLEDAQRYLNTAMHRSLGTSPSHVFLGIRPRWKENPSIVELVEREMIDQFLQERDEVRERANEKIKKVQEENRRNFDKRKEARVYSEGDMVAIKRTQQGPGLKFAGKFLGPYEIVKALRNNRYVVRKIGEHEGPMQTSTVADFIKPWMEYDMDDSEEESEMGGHQKQCND